MKILVTGGTGVIGNGVIPRLLERGHQVRLLSRHAEEDAKSYHGVEPFNGNVADAKSLHGAATGCDAVLHIAGIVAENPPELTFAAVNVAGTANILAEATRAGAKRFLFVSSLGADRGSSDYHKSKHEAEVLVERSPLDWTIVRPGNVFGPGDEVISLLLKMVRVLPAIPMIDSGTQPFQPVWYLDLGVALANALERDDLGGRKLELAGDDTTSMSDAVARLSKITGRSPMRLPVPMSLASIAARMAGQFIDTPVDQNKLTMLEEENVAAGGSADLRELMGSTALTSLDDGLKQLADALPEQLPQDGVGKLEHKKFFADIRGSKYTAPSLMSHFRNHLNEIMPIEFEAEPGATANVETGETLTGALPLRGNFQVRVEEVTPTHVVFATLEGHPLAGIVEFTTADTPEGLRFAIDIHARASNLLDLLAIRTIGGPMQSANWRTVVQRVIDLSGGTSDGVKTESKKLDDDESTRAEERIRSLVQRREREESASAPRAEAT